MRLKSLWHLDQLRARDAAAAQAHLLAVILAAVLTGDISVAAPIPLDAWLDDRTHPLSRWRWEALWHDACLQAIRGPLALRALLDPLPTLRRHLCHSPRQRSHQPTAPRHPPRLHTPPLHPLCASARP